jgi:hypothetical protein
MSDIVRCEGCRWYEEVWTHMQAGRCHVGPSQVRVERGWWCKEGEGRELLQPVKGKKGKAA